MAYRVMMVSSQGEWITYGWFDDIGEAYEVLGKIKEDGEGRIDYYKQI